MNKGTIGHHDAFNKFVLSQDQTVQNVKEVEDKVCATYFITFADPHRFSGLWEHLSNSTLLGRDEYPSTMTRAYDLLCHYCGRKKTNSNDGPANVSFAQIQQEIDDPVLVPMVKP